MGPIPAAGVRAWSAKSRARRGLITATGIPAAAGRLDDNQRRSRRQEPVDERRDSGRVVGVAGRLVPRENRAIAMGLGDVDADEAGASPWEPPLGSGTWGESRVVPSLRFGLAAGRPLGHRPGGAHAGGPSFNAAARG